MSREQQPHVPLRTALAVLALALASAGVALSAAACAGETSSEADKGRPAAAESTTGTATASDATTVSDTPGKEISADDYDASLFDDTSITIDNEWWPLKPGTRFDWRGSTEEDGERVPHRIVFTVTDLTKVIDGVRTVVGWDRDFSRGQLVESELIFLAQDKDGNVWHFGQYSETWEGKELVGGQAWLVSHLKGAKPGILMKAEPRLGTPAYSEGFAPSPFFWEDYAKVYKMGQRTCVPAGCFKNVLVTDEFEPRKPRAHQLKYYAQGVGNIRTGWRGSEDEDHEVLVLKKVERLDQKGVVKARSEAMKLETRASVYGGAPPAEPRSGEGE